MRFDLDYAPTPFAGLSGFGLGVACGLGTLLGLGLFGPLVGQRVILATAFGSLLLGVTLFLLTRAWRGAAARCVGLLHRLAGWFVGGFGLAFALLLAWSEL